MATFNKFECFVGDVGLKLHDLNTDTLRVFLTNSAPSVSADAVFTDLTDLATLNGYTAGGEDVTNTYSQTTGTGNLAGTDIVWTATADDDGTGLGGGAFRYAVLYNDGAAAKNLIGWWDYGSAITVADGETFTVDFGATILTLA
ncbi:MAG: hypothetical protein E4G97_00875 [Deltaproteobacteria bacterium]|nr:MAG: hypothetical protein E4G97_00875 [Deltaproteobacteria bacterium]